MTELEMNFHDAMLNICIEAKRQCNINFSRLSKMLSVETGVEVAKKLVNSNELSDGFISLMEVGRTDLSVENLILKDEWNTLFDEKTKTNAIRKLSK